MNHAQYLQTLEYVLDRMTLAGWLQGHVENREGAGILWTDKGHAAAKVFRELFDALGTELTAEEMAVLGTIIDTMSRYPRAELSE